MSCPAARKILRYGTSGEPGTVREANVLKLQIHPARGAPARAPGATHVRVKRGGMRITQGVRQ